MADIDIAYDPISINSGPLTIQGLDNIKLAVTQPIETKSALTLSVPDTIKTDGKLATDSKVVTDSKLVSDSKLVTDSKAAIDLQPVVLDQCLRITLGPLPVTQICFPNRQRIGLTVFGVEVFGLTLDGEAQILVGDPPKPPRLVAAPVNHPPHQVIHGPGGPPSAPPARPSSGPPASGGLVVKLGG